MPRPHQTTHDDGTVTLDPTQWHPVTARMLKPGDRVSHLSTPAGEPCTIKTVSTTTPRGPGTTTLTYRDSRYTSHGPAEGTIMVLTH